MAARAAAGAWCEKRSTCIQVGTTQLLLLLLLHPIVHVLDDSPFRWLHDLLQVRGVRSIAHALKQVVDSCGFWAHTHTQKRTHTLAHTHTHTLTHTHTNTHTHRDTHTHTHANTHTNAYTPHTHANTHTNTYTPHTHTHTHTPYKHHIHSGFPLLPQAFNAGDMHKYDELCVRCVCGRVWACNVGCVRGCLFACVSVCV